MRKKVQYIDVADKQRVLLDNKGLILIEEQNITEGNFLIFTDVKPIEHQLQEQAENQLTIMEAIVTLYEDLVLGGV